MVKEIKFIQDRTPQQQISSHTVGHFCGFPNSRDLSAHSALEWSVARHSEQVHPVFKLPELSRVAANRDGFSSDHPDIAPLEEVVICEVTFSSVHVD